MGRPIRKVTDEVWKIARRDNLRGQIKWLEVRVQTCDLPSTQRQLDEAKVTFNQLSRELGT